MANLANKYKLGLFVVTSIVILISALFLFGFFAFMKPRVKLMTIVNSSVQGLSVGAKVKFSGVPIGEVTAIKIAECDFIYIYMEVYTEALAQCNVKDGTNAFQKYLKGLMNKGLRCQLRYEGITGNLYQELQYFDLKEYPVSKISEPKDLGVLYIPSVQPVLFGSIMRRIDVSLDKISGIDEIFKDVGSALKKVNEYLGNPKIDGVINNVNQISNNIEDVTTRLNNTLTKEKIDLIVSELSGTMTEIRQVINNLNKEIIESNLPETSKAARALMKTTIKQLSGAIDNFNSTAQSVRNLTNELDNNPASLVWGTNKNKIIPSY